MLSKHGQTGGSGVRCIPSLSRCRIETNLSDVERSWCTSIGSLDCVPCAFYAWTGQIGWRRECSLAKNWFEGLRLKHKFILIYKKPVRQIFSRYWLFILSIESGPQTLQVKLRRYDLLETVLLGYTNFLADRLWHLALY